jgi:molybdate transport system ATP-binding protein
MLKKKILIEFKNVSIKKGETVILKDINFEIKQGQNWAIIGENGSGKSTLLNAIAENATPASGHIIKSENIKTVLFTGDFKANRLVSQSYQYYQQRYNSDDADITPTVYQIIQNQLNPLYTVDVNSVALTEKLYTENDIEHYAKLLKINHLLHRKIITLSNGETRRVRLLNVLLKKPQLLLLDNPFVGLDVESRQTLHTILQDIMLEGIQIVLVCTPNEIPQGISDVIALKEGKIEKILRGPFVQNWKQNDDLNAPKLDTDILSKIKSKPIFDSFENAVNFRNVTIQYKGEKVVNGIDWVVKKGEKWALMGPNGSGKSTILSLIMADNPQGYGNDYDLFDRKRGSGESIWDIKKRIGFVSPEFHLYTNTYQKVWAIVASGLFDTPQLSKPLTDAQIETVKMYLQLFDLDKDKNKLLNQLSMGQQRWVFLARALVKNPPLLILDEPCQGLDEANMVSFRNLVNDLVVSLDKTLIYVTHYEAEIPACVDRVFRIEKGNVVGKFISR